jgi:hypothetical protein
MAHPRIRDFLSFVTTLPAAMAMLVCLVLPHPSSALLCVPFALLGCLPVAWHAMPRIRTAVPELVLAFTMIVMALFVVTIPFAIWLMWGYAKKQFRGELLTAICSTALVMMWLVAYPFLALFADAPPEMTWYPAIVELFGLVVWTSAATSRPVNADDARSLHRIYAPLGFELHV